MSVEWQETFNVSRETYDDLTRYAELVGRWTQKINLISKASLQDIWQRHIWDSAQIYDLGEPEGTWLDIGSGGGFPGIVVAIMAKRDNPARKVVLVECDQRKAAFLRTVIRELQLNASVEATRIEALDPAGATVVSARALASLSQLLGFADRHLQKGGSAIFMKGAQWQNELSEAQSAWSFDHQAHTSQTDPTAAVLLIKGIHRA